MTIELSIQFKRSVVFFAALALNQLKPNVAIQVMQTLNSYFATEQIKLLALADLCYVKELNEILSCWASNDKLSKHKISKDIV